MLTTFGDYPPVLLKLFARREYAEQFPAGSIRFTLLDRYKTIKDMARQDTGERNGFFAAPNERVTTVHLNQAGELFGTSEAPGDINYKIAFGNPTYIVCCTDPDGADIDALKNKFGQYVVRINDPDRLGQELTDHTASLDKTHPLAGSVVEAAKVTYDKGQRREAEPSREEVLRTAYAQKDASFAVENEVRLVVFRRHPVNREESEVVTTIQICPLAYAELIMPGS